MALEEGIFVAWTLLYTPSSRPFCTSTEGSPIAFTSPNDLQNRLVWHTSFQGGDSASFLSTSTSPPFSLYAPPLHQPCAPPPPFTLTNAKPAPTTIIVIL